MVPGISNHEHARKWQPGNGGLCMHTIMRDGNRVHLGISTGGHYLSEDGGETFKASNKGVGAGFAPDPYPEFGQCVHKIARHDDAPGRLYMQNHGGWAEWTGPGGPRPDIGVLRSDDHGHTWRSIAKGLPSDFGFPIVVHPHDADTVYVMPLEPATRTCPGGAPAVWRSENGGDSWSRLARGLPKKESYFTVLRDAMDIDRAQVARALLRHDDRSALDRAGRAARSGTACSIRCRRSTTSRSRWCEVTMAQSIPSMRVMMGSVAVALLLAASSSRLSAQPPPATRIASEPDVQGARRLFSAWLEGQMLERGLPGVAVGVVARPGAGVGRWLRVGGFRGQDPDDATDQVPDGVAQQAVHGHGRDAAS